MQQPNSDTDDEERALAIAAQHKHDAIAALVMARNARKDRGAETLGIEESIDFEQMTLSGYERALQNRRRELMDRSRGKK